MTPLTPRQDLSNRIKADARNLENCRADARYHSKLPYIMADCCVRFLEAKRLKDLELLQEAEHNLTMAAELWKMNNP